MGTVAPSISPLEVSATVTEGAHPEQPATAASLAEARKPRLHDIARNFPTFNGSFFHLQGDLLASTEAVSCTIPHHECG